MEQSAPIHEIRDTDVAADVATALGDFSYHIGTAMDSPYTAGYTVHYRGGDTLWLRSATARWRFVRRADSAEVGYVMSDSARNMAVRYGVRTYVDLIEDVRVQAHRPGATSVAGWPWARRSTRIAATCPGNSA